MTGNPASIVKHSVLIAGHQTSVSLENAFWDAFCQIAATRAFRSMILSAKSTADAAAICRAPSGSTFSIVLAAQTFK